MAQLDRQSPHENTCRRQFDHAVEAECEQHKAAGRDACAIATAASTIIQAMVNHSSLNASRISGNRSGRGGRINGGGAQHSVIRQL